MPQNKLNVLMVGPQLTAPSGISAVVNHWIGVGLLDSVNLRYLSTLDERDWRLPIRKVYSAGRAYSLFLAHIFSQPVDVVHIHISSGASFYRKLLVFRLARLRSLKTVVHLHGSTFKEFYGESTDRRARLIRSIFDGADSIIVLSKAWEAFARTVTSNRNIYILYNGATIDVFKPQKTTSREVVIASMGKLGNRKGTFDLIEAFRLLSGDVPEARLVLGGDGEVDKARALVEHHGLSDKVTITGWVSGEDKLAVFNRADVYVLPSYNEGLPGSVVEAMAARTPIVSTPVGGIPEAVLEGDNGFLVQPGDIDALRDRLAQLCRDPVLRERMGQRSQQLIEEKFDAHKLVSDLTEIYQKTLAPRELERTAT